MMRSPVLFLVLAVGLTLITFYTAVQAYPRFLSSIPEVMGIGLFLSSFFLLVAIDAGFAAVRTRNAPLAGRKVASLAAGLVLGVFLMLGMFMAMG